MARVLIVDDDAGLRSSLGEVVRDMGLEADEADSVAQARERWGASPPEMLLVDLMLPDGSGLDLLDEMDTSSTRVVVLTGHPDVDAAVRSLRARVHDFLVKPGDMRRLKALLEPITGHGAEHVARAPDAHDTLVGESPVMRRVFEEIARVAPSGASVLVVGESGTGKELVARAIHARSERAGGPFLAVNCGALPGELIASELFGHERGSFTGASRQHQGVFERARGGTLFLDEITEMSSDLQTNLLRVLETSTFRRVGGTQDLPCDVRVVAATNTEPEEAVSQGNFREDLYFRLNVFPIRLPALRERTGDIPRLAEHMLGLLNADRPKGQRKSAEAGAVKVLEEHDWPGNVRELWNVMQRAHILADDTISEDVLRKAMSAGRRIDANGQGMGVGASIRDMERQLILDTLEHFDGDKRTAAKVLGVSLKTLYNRLKEYEREDGDKRAAD